MNIRRGKRQSKDKDESVQLLKAKKEEESKRGNEGNNKEDYE